MKDTKRGVRYGFTLVELMIASSILVIGIVVISRGLLTMVGALDTSSNKIKAVRILESKMNDLQQTVLQDEYIEQQSIQEKVMLGQRQATYRLEVEGLDLEDELSLQEEIAQLIEKGETLNTVLMSLDWYEGSKQRGSVLGTYFVSNESVQDFGY